MGMDDATLRIELTEEPKRGAFWLVDGDDRAGEMTWRWLQSDVMDILHTGVREAYEGQGWARALVMQGIEFARERGVTIVPHCEYARAVITADAELSKLLTPGWRELL
jgi:predicted GNAT family acetyltransferase